MRWLRLATRLATLTFTVMVAAAAAPGTTGTPPVGVPGAASTIDPRLGSQLRDAALNAQTSAIIVLREQASLAGLPDADRGRRLAAVERRLRTTAAATQASILAWLDSRRAAGTVSRVTPLWITNAVSVTATPEVLSDLARRGDVRAVLPEETRFVPAAAPAEPNLSAISATALWQEGYRGAGIVVAAMDTGVDGTHPDLAPRWRGGTNSWFDPHGEHPTTPTDRQGHGTATLGVIVGGDAGGTSIGVAPDAEWIAVKIFNDRGVATSTAIHQGFQWLLDPDGNPDTADAPHVVNNSWTFADPGCYEDFQPDIQALRAAGVLAVFAAGNAGPEPGTSRSPANNPAALAVGAVDQEDAVWPASSRGPSACSSADPTFPDLVAPGVNITTSDLLGGYRAASGTSLAAPHVTGGLALLLDAVGDLSAEEQEAALLHTATDLGIVGPDNVYGNGRPDLRAAADWARAQADFNLTAAPAAATVRRGQSASYQVEVAPFWAFEGEVRLSASGVPAGATATIQPELVSTPGSATISVSTTKATPRGTYLLTIEGTGSGRTHQVQVELKIR